LSSAPRLLARAALAPDLPALLSGWRQLPAGWCAVTPDGDLADERGLVVVRGRADDAAGEAARQHARRRELAALVEALDRQMAEAGEAAAKALVAASEARREREEAFSLRSDAELHASVARAAQARAAESLEHAQEMERALSAELASAQVPAS